MTARHPASQLVTSIRALHTSMYAAQTRKFLASDVIGTALVKSGVPSLKGLFKTIVEHTAAELFDAATQDRSTTDMTMRVGVDRRAKRPQR